MIQHLILFCFLVASAFAQSIYTDAKSGISFSQWKGANGLSFGIALPTAVKDEFIGQISGPVKTAKWGGISLGPKMVGPLLLVSYPNGASISNTIRKARMKSGPPKYDGNAKMVPIASGTYVTDEQWVSTFLCSGCILDSGLSFNATDAQARLGYAVGNNPPRAGDADTAMLGMHGGGQGTNIVLDLAAAKNEKYATWAALAKV